MSTELWILPRHNKRCTLQFLYLKNVIHMILFVIKNIYHPAALKLSVNSLKYIETAFSWRKDESYSQYNHPHLNHKVWKKHV